METSNYPVLPNCLVEMVLLVGMDDNTSLIPSKQITTALTKHEDKFANLFDQDYEPQVLAALSADSMVYFHPMVYCDPSYPPDNKEVSVETSAERQERGRLFSAQDTSNVAQRIYKTAVPKTNRSMSYNPRMFSRHASLRRQTLKKQKTLLPVPELPISEEVIQSIPSFCFPDGAKVYKQAPENSTHFLVLTDMSGKKTYTTCLTFYRTYIVEKDDQGNIYMQFEPRADSELSADKYRCYVPHCCVTVSKFPYFTVMKECLSSLVMQIELDPEELYTFVKEYGQTLTLTPVPPAGNVSVELKLYKMAIQIQPPSHSDRPVIDIPLHIAFLCLPVEVILKILSCVLVEERLVFLSSNMALLTIVMETIRNMILPFRWRFTYVPVLSSRLLGYLQAPGTFMFGCHSKHKEEAEQVAGLVLVDIDEGTVTCTPDPMTEDQECCHSILQLPQEAAKVFSTKSKHFKLQFDCLEVQRPFLYDFEEMRRFRMEKIKKFNHAITSTCLELMVNLFRGVGNEVRKEHSHFNKAVFLGKQPAADKPFYSKVLKTDMFKMFLEDRMKEKNDYWSEFEMRTRKDFVASKTITPAVNHPRMKMRRTSTLTQIISQTAPVLRVETTAFPLPDLLHAKTYIKNSIKSLRQKIKECQDFDERISYIYLRCLFHMADRNNKAAIEDLGILSSSNARILPKLLLKRIYDSLKEDEKREFSMKQANAQLLEILEAMENDEGHQGQQKIQMDPVCLPDHDFPQEEFMEYVSLLEMTSDYETMDRLFEALCGLQRSTYVEQMTFQMCAAHWEDNLTQNWKVKIEQGHLEETETILKLSTMIKTDYGIGRIGLTDKRLFFLKDVSNHFKEIARLGDIVRLEKSQQVSRLSSNVDTILIHRKDNTVFMIHLKEERNWWFLVLQEMWAGKVISNATRDLMAVPQAMQNALLIDAVIGSGQEDCATHSKSVEEAARHLAYYTRLWEQKKHVLPQDTKEALQHRIDPNLGERERKAVHALLYTGGDGELSPRLWCGLSDGKVKVYNAIDWVLESEFVQTKQCVACLTAVGSGQVWVGSRGVFIIDVETITCNKTLLDHPDLVVAIVLYQEDRYVFTASLDGTIIKWDVQLLKHAQPPLKLKQIKELRSLRIHQDMLLCGTWNNILLVSLTGEVSHAFQYQDDNRKIQLDSFIALPNNEIWAGCRREEKLVVWDIESKERKAVITVHGGGIGTLTQVEGRVWVATKSGSIAIFTVKDRKCWKVLDKAHDDAIRALCAVRDRYMISGASSKDGRVAVWSATANTTESGNYIQMLSHHF